MRTKVQKWGNSLALRIPKAFAEEADVVAESVVELTVDSDGQLIVTPSRAPQYELADLLSEISDENLHDELWTDEPKGREVW